MLSIRDLHAKIEGEDTEILKGVNLDIQKGQVHAIMGPNGSGKSTLAKVLVGDPSYEVTAGSVTLDGKDLLELEPDERALDGLFLAFQYPVEIPGVNNADFLRMAYNAHRKHRGEPEVDPMDFDVILQAKLKEIGLKTEFLERNLNQGFSGGEKKRNEILQLSVLNPKLSILDETDSGLDIDALKVVADAVNRYKSQDNAVLLITHYQRLLNYIQPDVVHVMAGGRIIKSGDKSLALALEEKGYDWVLEAVAKA